MSAASPSPAALHVQYRVPQRGCRSGSSAYEWDIGTAAPESCPWADSGLPVSVCAHLCVCVCVCVCVCAHVCVCFHENVSMSVK